MGDYGIAELEEGESKLNVRNRLKGAAERRGLSLEFLRTKGDAIRFKLCGDGTEVFAPAEEPEEELAIAA